ncbi:hypothetical protein CHS0354_001039 [Potamilus streckersoni]|uniref:Uncharacterized protein n=1 Tax=Potamilus streckersoni TaxID=2493646 RepID=A0AAE0W1Z5_9BIVA|nr:hypothetical protein CHS0354_001039 [Potamilus streckersoni]
MAQITIIALLAILLQVNNVFSQFPGVCLPGEIPTGRTCLGFVNQQCPLGQRCRNIQGSSLGLCCRSFSTGGVCPFGSFPTGGPICGGFVGAQCPRGSFCQYVPRSDYGHCCSFRL